MKNMETKCVLVIDEKLPIGIIGNIAAILGITLGKHAPELVGPSVADSCGIEHLGIVKKPVPILSGSKETLLSLREKSMTALYSDLLVVGFSDAAQKCKTYEEYIANMQKRSKTDYLYFGVGIYGDKKKVNRLTGGFSLLR
ncbi:MAG: DUF2000 domain-containing protein [Bacillus sp. (in: firmicutes)]